MPNYTEDEQGNPIPILEPLPQGENPRISREQAQETVPDEPSEESESGWGWVGSPSHPEAKESDDGISDLFTVTPEDVGASDEDLSDLTDVDIDRDVMDADADGSLDDLTTVTEKDIMGSDDFGQRPSRPASRQPRMKRRAVPRYQPPSSMGGMSA